MNHPSHGLFVDIVSFSEFFGNERYIERNKKLNELYMSDKIGYVTKTDSIVGTSFQKILPAPYGKVSTGSYDVDVTAQAEKARAGHCNHPRRGKPPSPPM